MVGAIRECPEPVVESMPTRLGAVGGNQEREYWSIACFWLAWA